MLEFKLSGTWGNSYLGTYFISTHPKKNSKNELCATSTVNTCREFFIRSLRAKINNGDGFVKEARKAYGLITSGRYNSEMRVKTAQKALMTASEKGLYIINSFEKYHKWPLTKIYPVKCTNYYLPLVFFAGPRKWTTSPYLMSIWALLLRVGKGNYLPEKLLTLNHEDLVRQLAISCKTSKCNDANQISATLREWDPFLSLYKDLFGGNTRKYHWQLNHLNGHNDRPEGIMKLMNRTSGYKDLYTRYYNLKKEKGLK